MSFEIGTLVVLNKKAIKSFYGTKDRPLYFVRGYSKWDNFDSNSFVDFVGTWLGFESGNEVGTVTGTGAETDHVKVTYINYVTGELDFSFYRSSDLTKIRL